MRASRRALLLLPALAAAAALGPLATAATELANDPGSARLLDVLAAASWLMPLAVGVVAGHFHQWRVTFAALLSAAVAAALALDALVLAGPGAPALMIAVTATLGLASQLDERGLRSRAGLRRFALAGGLVAIPALLAARMPDDLLRLLQHLGPSPQPTPGTGLPWTGLAACAVAVAACARAPGKDADVVSASLASAAVALFVAVGCAEGSAWAAPPGGPAVAILGASCTALLGTIVVAWRRGYVDDLTGIPGRRALDAQLDAIAGSYAIAVVDVDHFKRFNDEHGHDAGDDVLRIVARVLRTARGGAAYRQGGEEFVILFEGASLEDAEAALDDLREAIEQTPLLVRGGAGGRRRALRITASMGVAATSRRNPTPRETLRAADQALLRAKRNGRNRVEVERRATAPGRSSRTARARPAGDARSGRR